MTVPRHAAAERRPSNRTVRRASRFGSVLLVVAVPVVAFHQVLFGDRTLLYADAVEYFLPIYRIVVRSWLHGHIPTWNRYAFSGYPLLGSSQGGVFYLPHILYGLIDPRRAQGILFVGHLICGGLGVRAFSKRLWGHELAAAASGVAFTLNAFAFGHLPHNSVWAGFALLPWVLLAVDHAVERPRVLPVAAGAACLAFTAFGGHPQSFWISATAAAGFGVIRALITWNDDWEHAVKGVAVSLGTAALGAALGAVQLLPTAIYSQQSGRPRLTLGEAMTYSYPASHLPLLGFPYLFGATARVAPYTDDYRGTWLNRELAGYLGLAVLVLIAVGLPLIWRRAGGRALLLFFPLQLLLVLGPSTPVGPWVFRTLPFFDRFRAWGRHVLVLDIIVAVLCGAGARMLVTGTRRMRVAALWRAMAMFGAWALIGIWAQHARSLAPFLPDPSVRTLAVVVPLLAAAGATLAVALSLADRRVAGALVLVVLIGDGWAFASAYEWRALTLNMPAAASYVDDRPMIFGNVYDAPGGIDRFGIDAPLLQMSWVGKRLLSINGYDPIYPLDYAIAVGDMVEYGGLRRDDLWTRVPAIADLLRLSTFVAQAGTTSPAPPPSAEWRIVGPIAGTPLSRYERAPRLGEAFLVGAAQRGTFNQVVDTLRNAPVVDPSSLVWFDGTCAQCAALTSPGPAGPDPVVQWGDRTVRLKVQASRPALAVVSQSWFQGWRATVDGKPAPVVRVFGLTTGVPVPAGSHDVVLTYDAPGLRSGFIVSASASALIICALAIGWWQRRRGRTMRRPPVSGHTVSEVSEVPSAAPASTS